MGAVLHTISVEDTVNRVLELLESGDSSNPRPLLDLVVSVGQDNRYKQDLALRLLRAKLKPGGSHAHLTVQKRWAWFRERWAKELGLDRGRPVLNFEPTTDTAQALAQVLDSSPHLPAPARDAVDTIRRQLVSRANRKLDETSAAIVGEGVEDLVHEIEVAARVIEEKDARIEQAERHNEHLRLTNDRLLALMERQFSASATTNGVLTASDVHENDRGGTRSPTN